MTEPTVEAHTELSAANSGLEDGLAISEKVWIPDGRSLGEEIRRPRYIALLVVAVVVIALQLWVLF